MKIYTKTGDHGTTGLIGGDRVGKTDPRIECLGVIDELNAALGVARSAGGADQFDAVLERVQNLLFDLGAEVATPLESQYYKESVLESDIQLLEQEIDTWTERLEPLRNFILPGGSPRAAHVHLARTVCRRAERTLQRSRDANEISERCLVYINRLSDWLFTLARAINADAGIPDVKWTGRANRQ